VTVSFFEASRIQRNIFSKSETFEKCQFLFKFKKGDNFNQRPLKNVNFCLSSRKAIILTTGIH